MAKGYMVVHLDVTDPEQFEEYREKVPATIAQYGGRYLVRAGAMQTMEGDELPPRTVVLEFDSVEQAKAMYNSPEYQAAKEKRIGAADFNMIVVEGN